MDPFYCCNNIEGPGKPKLEKPPPPEPETVAVTSCVLISSILRVLSSGIAVRLEKLQLLLLLMMLIWQDCDQCCQYKLKF